MWNFVQYFLYEVTMYVQMYTGSLLELIIKKHKTKLKKKLYCTYQSHKNILQLQVS
jgi:hypothetical protein